VQGATTPSRPNFLFIYTDDQRWDAMSVVQREMGDRGRFPWFQTPNMDRLAAEGVLFRNAFVTLSLCAPSRAAFLTGRYNHLNGIANNFTPFPLNNVTWASELRKAGYRTAYIGKWHMDGQKGQRPGFDYSASFIGHARYMDPPFEINGEPTETKGWVDDLSTDYAINFIRTTKDRPWAMVVGYKSPHGPTEPPARWADKFAGCQARSVPNLGLHAPFRSAVEGSRKTAEPGPVAATRPVNLDYFRCVAAADEDLGKLLAVLDELKLKDNTFVIYTSDNGYYFGEHGLGDKRSAYDESLRIPMIVRGPGLRARGVALDQMVLNIDLAPTLLDFAGVLVPRQIQGRSWRPLLEGKPGAWRDSFFFEYFWEQQRGNGTPSLTGVRTATAKLIKYKDHEEWTELFYLAHDPYELKNLFSDPSAAKLHTALEAEYEKQKLAVGWVWLAYASDPAKFGRDFNKPADTAGKPLNTWVLDYRFDQDQGDQVTDSSCKANHGRARNTSLAQGRDGKKARRFDGQGCIDVVKSSSLNPAVPNWTVEITYKTDAPDGVLLAQGGASFGYCLFLEDGRPVFTVVGQTQPSRVAATDKTLGAWTTLRASITDDSISLATGSAPPVRAPLRTPITREPNDVLQIGDDLGSPVLREKKPPAFKGLIESVRICSGNCPR
jgi:arylsulfatase A-like enzyme